MNDLDDLVAVLDHRAEHANVIRPDLGDVRSRARRKQRTHQVATATAAVTAVGIGAGALLSTGGRDRRIDVADSTTVTPRPTAIVLTVPITTTRDLGGGADLTATISAPLPTYGPYGDDHLWQPAPTCAASARISSRDITTPPGAEGATTLTELPVTATPGAPRAYRVLHTAGGPDATGPWEIVVMVPGTTTGRRYRLLLGDEVLDSTTSSDPLTLLAATLDGIEPPTLPGAMTVEEFGPDDRVTATLPVDDVQPDSAADCESANAPIELGPATPPADEATADAAVRDAARSVASSSVALGVGQSIEPLEVHWSGPTSAWVKYQVVYFPASPDSGNEDQGPSLWAEVTFDGSSWAPTAEARCAYGQSRGVNDPCTALPPVQPMR